MGKIRSQQNVLRDFSLWFLLFTNVLTIHFAVSRNWALSSILWAYWFQSIAIGLTNIIRIIELKKFSTEGFKINGQQALPTKKTRISTAIFFLVHYGFFHLVYAVFLIDFGYSSTVLVPAALFAVTHVFSYFYNKPSDTKKLNIGTIMFYPYARIIPMHLTILLGSLFSGGLVFFLILKTFADTLMHIVEHRLFRAGTKT